MFLDEEFEITNECYVVAYVEFVEHDPYEREKAYKILEDDGWRKLHADSKGNVVNWIRVVCRDFDRITQTEYYSILEKYKNYFSSIAMQIKKEQPKLTITISKFFPHTYPIEIEAEEMQTNAYFVSEMEH